MKKPMEIQDYLRRIGWILLALFSIYSILSSFVFQNAFLFPFAYLCIQGLVFKYCYDKFKFIRVNGDNGIIAPILHFTGYLFNALVLPFVVMRLIISIVIHFNSGMLATDFTQNYLFVYPFLLIFDLIFILFFYYITKNATKFSADAESIQEVI